ncbi:hypothetical protein BH24ACT23_BH24ACT23_03790 [soil metagenome]
MRTVVVSDLHLGAGSDADMLQRREVLDVLLGAIEGADRLVLLGDVIELRDRPLTEALEFAEPVLRELAGACEGEVVYVPGNHDHRFVFGWLERRAVEGKRALGLAARVRWDSWPSTMIRDALGPQARLAYPGLWLRDDVYATHGHYLDRHLTIPTFERLGLALVERVLGLTPEGPDPLNPPGEEDSDEAEDYERIVAPVYSFLFAIAQAAARGGHPGGTPTKRLWDALSGGDSRSGKLRSWLLGSVALPGAVGVANRLGLGPVRADMSPNAISSAGVRAMAEVVEGLEVDAAHVIFGHTHRRGPLPNEEEWTARNGKTLLLNTGSWVHSPSLLRSSSEGSAYWPGTVCIVEDDGPPRLEHLLDEWTREDLAD